jgi:hypothetical protein
MRCCVPAPKSFVREALAPPAVAERDGDRALSVRLADDIGVERGDDRLGVRLSFIGPAALVGSSAPAGMESGS